MKRITAFFLGAVFFTACGSAAIKWPYLQMHVSPIGVWDYPNAQLLGFRQEQDRKLVECKPTRKDAAGKLIQECVVVFYPELEKIISDWKTTKQALIDCQKQAK